MSSPFRGALGTPAGAFRSIFRGVLTVADRWLGGSTPAPFITLSGTSINENSAIGTIIGTIGIDNPVGTYNFILLDGGLGGNFTLENLGGNVARLKVSSPPNYEAYAAQTIVVIADNGVDTPTQRTFVITINNLAESSSGIAALLIAMGLM